jgi:thioredoxin-dependent peroxiredoxin
MEQLKPQDKAPPFELLEQEGKAVKLADFKGRKVLLYFYPKADTPGCTTQSCSVRDAMPDLAKAGVAALGISPDTPAQQKKFDEKYNLGFPLLADTDHKVAEAYGAGGEKVSMGKVTVGIIRSSFLIDEEGRLVQAWYKVSPDETVPKAREALARMS